MGVPPREEEPSKEAVTSFTSGSSSGSLFTFGQLPGFFFHTCPALGPSPAGVPNFFSKMGFQPRGLWDGLSITYSGVVPPPF